MLVGATVCRLGLSTMLRMAIGNSMVACHKKMMAWIIVATNKMNGQTDDVVATRDTTIWTVVISGMIRAKAIRNLSRQVQFSVM